MIIDKTYNFDKTPKEFELLKDYHRRIVADIISQGHEFMLKNHYNHYIFVGIEGLTLLEDQSGFYINSISHINFDQISKSYIGALSGKDVYFDFRLKSNQVIFGSSINDINYYLLTKDRKEKLEKLNERISME